MIENKLLNMLVCPVTKGKLSYDRQQQCFISQQAKLRFPVVNGVPNMLIDAALPLEDGFENPKQPNEAIKQATKTLIDKTNEDQIDS